jgi:polar amino acid transport system substrate-binding protein
MKDLSFAVEKGSAGEEMATENKFKTVEVDKQSKALMEVASGTADAAIVDLLMAGAMIGEGTDYENLAFGLKLNGEEYGIGMRKGSDLAEKLNDFLKKAYEDGTIAELAEEYKISENIIEIK